jgi:uncharacterized protein YdiU (UPF0061 family)
VLIRDLLNLMSANNADFSQSFRLLSRSVSDTAAGAAALFADKQGWADWAAKWQQRLAAQGIDPLQVSQQMDNTNPALIARNHLVAEAIKQATEQADLTLFNRLHQALATPHMLSNANADFALPPQPQQLVKNTFCGT